MSNQPRRLPIALHFDRDEWELLVTLPRRILIAASTATAEGPEPGVADGLAGLAAIASGHDSPSQLIREVVAAIYAEFLHDEEASSEAEPPGNRARTLAAAGRASEVLSGRVDPTDASAYTRWLGDIASAVVGASATSAGAPGNRVRLADHGFLDQLRSALSTGPGADA